MIRLAVADVYDEENLYHSVYVHFLYSVLKERMNHPEWNISHTKLPTWKEHVNFIKSKPYKEHYVIHNAEEPKDCVGVFYVTHMREIGIFIAEPHRGKGYAVDILKSYMSEHMTEEFYANINPKNEKSIKFFESLDFKHIQNTYKVNKIIT